MDVLKEAYPAPSNAPVSGQPERRASAGEQRGLVSDVPLTPRSGATLHRGSRDVQADDSGTTMTAIAQSMLNGPPVMLSTAHLTPSEVARWVAHQRVQFEASTFDNRTQTTTISEKSWMMIMFKIETSRTLRENPSKNWR